MFDFFTHLSFWDIVLVLMVVAQATSVAYIYQPRLKALAITTPIPFTFASLALGLTPDTTNIMGLGLLLAFWHGVRWLHLSARVPIIASIALAFVGFCVGGSLLAPHLPQRDIVFWVSAVLVWGAFAALHFSTAHRAEQGHRSPLPVPLKILAVAAVILTLVFIKSRLRGFMTVSPMVGVVTAYETRRSLWTSCRYIPVLALALIPMMMVVRVLAPHLGLGAAIGVGWIVYMAAIAPIVWIDGWREVEEESTTP